MLILLIYRNRLLIYRNRLKLASNINTFNGCNNMLHRHIYMQAFIKYMENITLFYCRVLIFPQGRIQGGGGVVFPPLFWVLYPPPFLIMLTVSLMVCRLTRAAPWRWRRTGCSRSSDLCPMVTAVPEATLVSSTGSATMSTGWPQP